MGIRDSALWNKKESFIETLLLKGIISHALQRLFHFKNVIFLKHYYYTKSNNEEIKVR